MKSIVETEYFHKDDLRLVYLVQLAVALLPTDIGAPKGIRCHELTRAIKHQFPQLGVVDGKYGTVEHSWCTLPAEVGVRSRPMIIDVYAVGRFPQVQLIDTFPCLCHAHDPRFPVVSQLFRGLTLRDDIRENVVKKMNSFLDENFRPRVEEFERLHEKIDSWR